MPRGKEWFCDHGIGHYVDGSIHGCDGCCTKPTLSGMMESLELVELGPEVAYQPGSWVGIGGCSIDLLQGQGVYLVRSDDGTTLCMTFVEAVETLYVDMKRTRGGGQ